VISINNSVLNALKAGDIRKNYLFIGSLWTHGGLAPVTNNDKNNYNLLGSTLLANATMETYKMSFSCFSCHNNGSDPDKLGTVAVSHTYDFIKLKPLNPK
jgi:hypothetical protein